LPDSLAATDQKLSWRAVSMMGPLPTLVGPQLGLLLLPSPPLIPSHAWVLILCVLIAVASLHSVCCLLVTHSASMSSQFFTLMLSQG
jgi:hypothetical protein